LTASVYASRYGLSSLIIASEPGGMMAKVPWIENFPSYQKIRGLDLAEKMIVQVKHLGGEIRLNQAVGIERLASRASGRPGT